MFAVTPTITFDIALADLLAAARYCLDGQNGAAARQYLHDHWAGADHTLVSFTLRSGFDLYLSALALPPGSEVLMSAVNHPEMVAIVEAHGLVPVPVDVDPATMAPDPARLHRALGPRTRLVVVAHLFGAHFPLDDLAGFCRERGLLLVEDCAQSFGSGYRGHPASDAVMYSFGPMKTATALGGGVTVLRDPAVRALMAELQAAYPRLRRRDYASRILKFAGFWLIGSHPLLFGAAFRLLEALGHEPTDRMRGWMRSFHHEFRLERLRWQPPAPLLRLLSRRLRRPDVYVSRRRLTGEALTQSLAGIERPGGEGLDHSHWIFPILVDDPADCVARLRRQGIQAMPGLSNLVAIEPPVDRPDLIPDQARRILDRALIVPSHPLVTPAAVGRMEAVLRR